MSADRVPVRVEHLSVEGNGVCELRPGGVWILVADGTGSESQGQVCPDDHAQCIADGFARTGGDPADYYEGGRL